MSTIRRVFSGISSSISRARLDVDPQPVTPLTPGEPLQPVAPVRRGFSDESDFQADLDDVGASLAAHAPHLAGHAAPTERGAPPPPQLRVFSGESSFESAFESARPRYAQLLGSQFPSSLGAPGESSGGVGSVSAGRGRGGVSAPDMDEDLLSPEMAAWELRNLDTSTPTLVEPEDLLFMLDPPGSASARAPALELGDTFEDGIDASQVPPEFLDPAVMPAGPDDFLADTSDLGSMVPDEPSMGDAALAAASVQDSPAVASTPPDTSALDASTPVEPREG